MRGRGVVFRQQPKDGRSRRRHDEAKLALGIDWMIYPEMAESVPPAYAEFIGHQARAALERRELEAAS